MFDFVIHLILIAASVVVCFCIAVELVKVRVRRESAISDAGGIDEMVSLRVNSCELWLHIRGHDRKKPVMLVLHGGPGNPLMPIAHTFQKPLEKHFVVVQLDQRCAGKSYDSGIGTGISPTLPLMADDCLHVTMYLKERFHQEKILLLCHSWGTVLGTTLVRLYPGHYAGYIGVGQLVDFIENERICYDTVLADAVRRKDRPAMDELREIAPYPDGIHIAPEKCEVMRRFSTIYNFRSSLHGFGGAVRYVRSVLRSPAYTLLDTAVYAHNIFDTYRLIFLRDLAAYSVRKYPYTYRVPMYFISGEHDIMTPISMSKAFCCRIDCPDKEFYTIAGAGHSPMLDRPGLFADIVVNRIYPRIVDRKEQTP